MKSVDITDRKDIEKLVDGFYKRILKDEYIGFFFTEIIALDWEKHIPVMYDFWETTLLHRMKYKGNPMLKHLKLHAKHPLNSDHFERWLELWESTIYEYFQGEKADLAVLRARQIAELMKHKINKQSLI